MMLPFVLKASATLDLRLKIVPVSEAVAAVAKASGMRLETAPGVADRKITVLLRHAAPGEAMARIADVMRLRWEKVGDAMRLVPDTALENRERAQVAAERTARTTALRQDLERQAALGATPIAELKKRRDIAKAKAEGNGEDAISAFDRYTDLDALLMGDGMFLPVALSTIGPEGRRRLAGGEPMVFSAGPKPVGVHLPASTLGNEGLGDESDTLRRVIVLQVSGDGSQLESAQLEERSSGMQITGFGIRSGPLDIPRATRGTRFVEEMKAWDTPTLSDPLGGKKLDPKTPVKPSEWRAERGIDEGRTDADRLEWLHDAGGVDIVARADRYLSATTDPFANIPRIEGMPERRRPAFGMTFAGTVEEFVKNWRRRAKGYFRMEHGVLMFRPEAYWSRDEPSEKVLRRIESLAKPTLGDWAAFTNDVRPEQAMALAGGVLAVRRSMAPLVATPGLRFWKTLTPGQRTEAERRSLRVEDLTPAQRTAHARAVLDASRYGVFMPQALEAVLSGDASRTRFRMWKDGSYPADGSPGHAVQRLLFADLESFDVDLDEPAPE